MDNQDQRGAVRYIVGVLRKVTRIAQLLPFAYLFVLALYLILESFMPEALIRMADNLTNVTIVAVLLMLLLNKLLKLCRWHLAACLLPLLPKAVCYADSFLVTFTQEEIVLINDAIGIAFLVFLVISFSHIFQ